MKTGVGRDQRRWSEEGADTRGWGAGTVRVTKVVIFQEVWVESLTEQLTVTIKVTKLEKGLRTEMRFKSEVPSFPSQFSSKQHLLKLPKLKSCFTWDVT